MAYKNSLVPDQELLEIIELSLTKQASDKNNEDLSSFGPYIGLARKIPNQVIASSTFYNKFRSLFNAPQSTDETRRRALQTYMKNRVDYGSNSPHIGIPSSAAYNSHSVKGLLNKLRHWLVGGLTIQQPLAGDRKE